MILEIFFSLIRKFLSAH